MKQTPTRYLPALIIFCLALPGLAQAHPGHSAIDWVGRAPHFGHETEYGIIYTALALVVMAAGVAWLRNRNR